MAHDGCEEAGMACSCQPVTDAPCPSCLRPIAAPNYRLEGWSTCIAILAPGWYRGQSCRRSGPDTLSSSAGFQEEDRGFASGGRAAPLTTAEIRWYEPAVREALVRLLAHPNDTAAHVHSSLHDAYSDLEDVLSQLVRHGEQP